MGQPVPLVSLVMATVGRVNEVERFIESLREQSHRSVELIVVDQNEDDRLLRIVKPHGKFILHKHLRCSLGLSRARNLGLKEVGGDVVAFPDDDCWYPPDLLEDVVAYLAASDACDGVVGCVVDDKGQLSSGRWDRTSGPLNKTNVWGRGASVSLFLRRRVVDGVGAFDEDLGAGTRWGSGEETDYLLRALDMGFQIYYEPSFTVHHVEPVREHTNSSLSRAHTYGLGMGRVLRKHRFSLPVVAYHLARPIMGACLALLKRRPWWARFHTNAFRGRVKGWLG